MDFSDVLKQLKNGKKVSREGWNGKGMFIQAQFPDVHSKMKSPYIFMCPVGGDLVPWVASQTDLFADDWGLVE